MSYLDQIVQVNIDLASPAVSKNSFASILMLGAAPVRFMEREAWRASGAYELGDYVTNSAGKLYYCTKGGTAGLTAPTGVSGVIEDGTLEWQYRGQTPNSWQSATIYTLGTYIRIGERVYLCTTSGTSGASLPSNPGATVNDGTVVWTYQAPPASVAAYSSLEEVLAAGWTASEPVGLAATVAFAQSPKPAQIYIAIQRAANGSSESISTALNRAVQTSGWYVLCPVGIPEGQYETLAAWTESQYKLLAYPVLDNNAIVGAGYYRSLGIFAKTSGSATEIPPANYYLHIAYAVKGLNYEPGSETWTFKTLNGVTKAELSTGEIVALQEANLSCYAACGGQNITLGGKVRAGEWIDVLRFRDWLQNEIQTEIYSLFLANPKIPYTDNGISLIKNRLLAVLQEGAARGGIAEDEYDDLDNLIPGYTVTVPLAADLSASAKASRRLTGCSWQARLAGAVQAVEINGVLGYEFA